MSDRARLRSTALLLGAALVGSLLAVALLSLVWTPYDPTGMVGGRLEGPSLLHWAGTDRLGRDSLSQIMVGTRIAFLVGTGAVLIGALIGISFGIVAALAQGALDDALAATLDILIAFPTLLTAMLVVASLDTASLFSSILALGLALSPGLARLTRILARRILAQDFVLAARISGTSTAGIVVRHVLPNIWPTLIINLALQFSVAVIAEASLSYLGLGAPPPHASWGRLLQEAQSTVYTAPLSALAPGFALVLLVVGLNALADGLRDRFDPARSNRT